jgi:hypothetical protein
MVSASCTLFYDPVCTFVSSYFSSCPLFIERIQLNRYSVFTEITKPVDTLTKAIIATEVERPSSTLSRYYAILKLI